MLRKLYNKTVSPRLEMMVNSYPVRKVTIEFKPDGVYGNGYKFRDMDELVQWLRETEKVHRNPYVNAQA